MKLCWDNLKGLHLSKYGNLKKGRMTLIYKDRCEVCEEPYLTLKYEQSEYCCISCAKQVKYSLIGNKYGRLLVLSYSHTKDYKVYWNCRCDCGKNVIVYGSNLKKGRTKSCGCLRKELTSKCFYKHGLSGTKEYHCYVEQRREARKLNQTPANANQDKIMLYYKICAYLNEPLNYTGWHVDHHHPLAKGGLHHEDNLQILDATLNMEKHDKWPLSEKEMIKYKGVRI